MPVDRASWVGMVDGRVDPVDCPVVEVPLARSKRGGSGTFLARASDRRRWWVKPQNSPQGPRVVISEFLVGRLGAVIGAPVCDVRILRIPADLVGWEPRSGLQLEEGLASGSAAIAGTLEDSQLLYRDRDDNERRHAGILAMFDLCWGADQQWLYAARDDRKIYSHDHGGYFPDAGPNWDETALLAHVTEAHPFPVSPSGLSASEVHRLASVLRDMGRTEIRDVLVSVPGSWPITDVQLDAIGFFVEARKDEVATRLDELALRI